jgi:putative PIN family toxin of toxin-antitoxin system
LKLILDTNVWLDWLLFDDPSVAALKAAVAEGRAEIFIDGAGEAELVRVLAYDLGKHSIDAEKQATCLAECLSIAKRFDEVLAFDRAALPRCADPDDQVFLEAAAAARADYLVTKDRELLELGRRKLPFQVVSPSSLNFR